MAQSGTRREVPNWVAAALVVLLLIVIVIAGVRMYSPETPANKVTVIGPGSKSSYLSHYGNPPGGGGTPGTMNGAPAGQSGR